MTLSSEIIDLIRLDLLDNPNKVGRVGEVAVMG